MRIIMRKVMVGVAAVRLRLWLCLWVWLRYILNPANKNEWGRLPAPTIERTVWRAVKQL